MRHLLVIIWLLGISVWNAEAISSSGPVSNEEEYAQFWRAFPTVFPDEKFYLGEQGKQKALEDKQVEEELANRARTEGLALDVKARELLKRFEQAWLARKAYEQQVHSTVEIKPEETKRFYKLHKKDYFEPETVDIGQIFIEVPPEATDEERHQARKKIEAAWQALEQGKPFEEVAKRYSEAESAEFGGRAGRLPRGQADKNIDSAAFKLKKGELSEIVQSRHGFHILKSFGRYPAEQRPLEEVAASIESRLSKEQERARLEKYLKQLAKAEGISTFFDRMEKATSTTIVLQLGKEKFTYQDFTGRAAKRKQVLKPGQWPQLWPQLFQEELLAMAAWRLGLHSPEEIQNYYQEHKASFIRIEHARCQVLSVNPLLLPEHPAQRHRVLQTLQQRLETFLKALPSAKSFAEGAQKLAKDLPGAKFFDTGMIVPAGLGRHFDWAVEKLNPGELSPVVKRGEGFFIIRCLAKEPKRQLTLSEVKDRVEQLVKRQKQIQRLQELRD